MADTPATKEFSGKVALVTGASRGLGKSIAVSLAKAGATVALVSRDAAQLDLVRQEIEALGGNAAVFQADVSIEADVVRLAAEVSSRLGNVQMLVNNAGINLRKNLIDFSLEEWRSVMDTNLTSVFLMCRAFVPCMRGLGYGRILNLTSMLSHIALPGRSAYCASKTGLLGLIRTLALELAADGITVNGISPGPIATDMNLALMQDPQINAQFLARIPVGHWGKVEDIGTLACYLCSEAARFITGTDILIDGGWCAQ